MGQSRANTLRGPLVILVNFLPIMAVASMAASLPIIFFHFEGGLAFQS